MVRKKEFKIIFAAFFAAILFTGCANQQPPGGGIVDEVPPKVVETYPDNGTLNYDNDYIEFTFSEYVDKRSVKDALFISPAIDGIIDYDWSGATVRISFEKPLQKNRTYTFMLGTDIVDLHNRNKMADAYALKVSTGRKIDKGIISGRVFDDKAAGTMVFAYILDDTALIDPAIRKPDYVSQVGVEGKFKLTGLVNSSFRIFAVKDAFKDLIFQSDQDLIGCPSRAVVVNDEDTSAVVCNLPLVKIDTVKPRLLNAVMTDRHHILLTFSEEIEMEGLESSNSGIIDSAGGGKYEILSLFRGKVREKELVALVRDSIARSDKLYFLLSTFSDKAGNVTQNDFASLTYSDRADTALPGIYRISPMSRSKDVDLDSLRITVTMDEFNLNDSIRVTLEDTLKKQYPLKLVSRTPVVYTFAPFAPLKGLTDYIISIDLRNYRTLSGRGVDTVIQSRFTTMNNLDYSGVSGKVINFSTSKKCFLELRNTESNEIRKMILAPTGKFSFDRIKPGKYSLFAYYDENSDGRWNEGFPYPFKPSEPFYLMKEAINVPARWSVIDVVVDLKEMK